MLDKHPGDIWQKFAGHRMLMAYQMCHPGKKLNFMGSEFGHFIEWKFDDQLDWFLLQYERHPEMLRCIRELNELYQRTPALWQIDDSWDGFMWLNADDCDRSILSFLRMDREGNALMCVINFTPAFYGQYKVGLPAHGYIRELFNTDRAEYGGSNQYNAHAIRTRREPCGKHPWSADIVVPPLSTVIYTFRRPQRKKASDSAE